MIASLLALSCQFGSDPQPIIDSPSATPRKPDILLVVLDTTRADAFQSYGNNRPVGENLATLAQMGTLFTQAWTSSSWTWPSHASLFTGLYPWEHGAHFAPPSSSIALKPDPLYASEPDPTLPTLAQRLHDIGYDTAAFSANRLVGPDFVLSKGFAVREFLDDDSKVVTRVQSYLKNRAPDKPLFLFVNLMSAHTPWFFNDEPWVKAHQESLKSSTAPDWMKPHLLPNEIGLHPFFPHFKESLVYHYISGKKDIPESGKTIIRDLYEAEVRRSDLHLGQVLSMWNVEDSVIAVTSDHGEYLGEYRLLEHGRTLYPEVLHVPLVWKSPSRKNGVIDAPIPMHFIHDEILREVGLDAKESLFQPPESVFAGAWVDHYWAKDLQGRFTKGYRLQRRGDEVYIADSTGVCEGFQLEDNRLGSTLSCPDTVAQTLQNLFIQSKTGPSVESNAKTLEQLQKLGYVGH